MARPRKKSPAKGKSFLEQDRYTAELTSGQLVFGISILLVFGLTCFLLGILVGRFEPSQPMQVAAAPSEEEAAAEQPATTLTGEEPEPAPERRTVAVEPPQPASVREDMPSAAGKSPPPSPTSEPATETTAVAKAQPDSGPKDLTGPQRVEYREPSESVSMPAADKKPEPASDASAKPEAEAPREIVVELPKEPDRPEEPAAEKPKAERVDVAKRPEPLEPVEPAETSKPEPAAAAAPAAPAPPSGAFAIQVAAMSKPANAEALQKRFASELSHPVRVERSPSRRLSIVLVGAFDTRSDASAALRDFRERYPNFSDAFIRASN